MGERNDFFYIFPIGRIKKANFDPVLERTSKLLELSSNERGCLESSEASQEMLTKNIQV